MKTEQEQIEKMARSMCGYCSTDGKCAVSKNGREPDICANVDTQHCLYKEYAERLIESGYGKVSEYESEIERLRAEFKQLETNAEILAWGVRDLNHENYELTEKVKQAQIDILNKLKERIKTAIDTYFNLDGGGYYLAEGAIDDIDGLIEEVEQ